MGPGGARGRLGSGRSPLFPFAAPTALSVVVALIWQWGWLRGRSRSELRGLQGAEASGLEAQPCLYLQDVTLGLFLPLCHVYSPRWGRMEVKDRI